MAERLKESSNRNPKFGTCCFSGKVVVPLLTTPPVELKKLYEGSDPRDKQFQNHIRNYNNALAMTSVGVKQSKPPGTGPPVWVIQGALHHQIGTLLPSEGSSLLFAQLYIHDPSQMTNMTMSNPLNKKLDRTTLSTLLDMLYHHNQLTRQYKKALDLTNGIPANR